MTVTVVLMALAVCGTF